MRSQAGIIFATESLKPAWAEPSYQDRCIYLRCTMDECITASFQDALIEFSGVEWRVVDLDTGHCPFFGMPEALAKMLVKFAEELSTTGP